MIQSVLTSLQCRYRAYGNENWEFDSKGYMQKRFASINDVKISAEDCYLSV